MKKVIVKTTVKTANVMTENRQAKIAHLAANPEYTLRLRLVPTEENPDNIYVVARIKERKPFYVGQVPKKTAFWLAKKLRAAENNKEAFMPYAVNPTIVGGKHGLNYGIHFEVVHEVEKAEKAA